jgi:GntR family transcriptional regulator, transcriptional repressor for pyruvate dehydrogenase complex
MVRPEAAIAYEPVERLKVYEQIAERLLAQIASRRVRPGDVLPPERELTQRYGTGRSSVREALRMLESKGVIEPAGNGSFAVAGFRNPLNASLKLLLTLDEANMREIYELRRILEDEAAALAAERRNEGALSEMQEAIAGMEEGLAGDRADRYIDADLRFHLVIAHASGNRLVLHTMHALRELIRRALESVYLIPSSPERSLDHHRLIHTAIAAEDAGRARAEMHAHLLAVESEVHHIVAQGLGAEGAARG